MMEIKERDNKSQENTTITQTEEQCIENEMQEQNNGRQKKIENKTIENK